MIHNYHRYSLLDVDGESGFLTLLTEEGQTKEDAALSRATDEPDETEFDAVNLSLPPSPRISFQLRPIHIYRYNRSFRNHASLILTYMSVARITDYMETHPYMNSIIP